MRALLYDIHGNLHALDAVLAEARSAGAESYVLGGDYAFAGAWPKETIERLRELNAVWIRGNGERWVGKPGDAPDVTFIQRAIAYCRGQLGEQIADDLAALPEQAELDGVLFCHASPRSDLETFMPTPAETDEEMLAGVELPVLVFGHSHLQFRREAHDRLLVNPGSVGMPCDGDRRAAYALWSGDTDFELRRVEYDWAAYVRDVREQLTVTLGNTVETLVRRLERAAFVD